MSGRVPRRAKGRTARVAGSGPDPATLSRLNDAVRAHQAGDLMGAKERYEAILADQPRQPDALHLRGVIAHQQGDQALAEQLIGRAITVQGRDPAYHNSLGTVLLARGRPDRASRSFQRATALAPGYAEAHNNLGNANQMIGNLDAARAAYGRALEVRPGYPEALCNLGKAHHSAGDLKSAEEACRQALARRPTYVRALKHLADVLAEQGRSQEAEALFLEALDLAPSDAECQAGLAALLERRGDLEPALTHAEAALSEHADDARASLVAARCDRRLGRADAALLRLERLQTIVSGPDRPHDEEVLAAVSFEIAISCDRLGRYPEAYAAYKAANAHMLAAPAGTRVERKAFPAAVAALTQAFTPEWVATWPAAQPDKDERVAPIFLVGFPRSGTTLLDQILDSHPGLATIEEKPLIDIVKAALESRFGPYPEALARLDAAALDALRAVYWDAASVFVVPTPGVRLVDKMPLNLVDAGLIHRLFPDAPILLALRHPCDVVLSAFFQPFRLNPAMAQFTTLPDTAACYAACMGLWLQYRRVLAAMPVVATRYEDMVADMGGETARILDALGLPWDDAVLGYRDHARGRAISTPSYHQVVQPIYARSVARWRHYADQFKPVLPILAPFVGTFGYTVD